MAHTYEDLKGKTIGELREIAKDLHHPGLQGYTQMNKEHLLPAICAALGIDTHHHHHHRAAAPVAFDKAATKAALKALKAEREQALAGGDHVQLKAIRRHMHTLKHRLRAAAV
jgi:hypothetical protein